MPGIAGISRDQDGRRDGDLSVLVLEDLVLGEVGEKSARRVRVPAALQIGELTIAELVREFAEIGASAGHAGTALDRRLDLQAATIDPGKGAR